MPLTAMALAMDRLREVLSIFHVQPSLAGQDQAAPQFTHRIQVGRDDGAGDEQVAAVLALIDKDVTADARRARSGFGSPARWTARYTVDRATENNSASSHARRHEAMTRSAGFS